MFPYIERNLLIFKIIQDNHLPKDIFSQIYAFCYESYKQKMTRRMRTLCFYINVADSRKNGFANQEENDTENPHWIFSVPDLTSKCINSHTNYDVEVTLQAVNCDKCGGYHYSNKIELVPPKILCSCFYN